MIVPIILIIFFYCIIGDLVFYFTYDETNALRASMFGVLWLPVLLILTFKWVILVIGEFVDWSIDQISS